MGCYTAGEKEVNTDGDSYAVATEGRPIAIGIGRKNSETRSMTIGFRVGIQSKKDKD